LSFRALDQKRTSFHVTTRLGQTVQLAFLDVKRTSLIAVSRAIASSRGGSTDDLARGARSPASAMPRSDRSPGEYSSHRGTPKKAPPSDRSSDYDSEDDDGPTLFGSILRTLMAGGAVVAIAVLVRVASAFQTRKRGASLRVLAVDIASRAP
jgi:hypothetical protein